MLYFKSFYWSAGDLQCCVNFMCTAKWFGYAHTYPLVSMESWVDFPVPHSRSVLVICCVCSSVCMSVPASQFIHPPLSPRSPLHCFPHLWLYFCFVDELKNLSYYMSLGLNFISCINTNCFFAQFEYMLCFLGVWLPCEASEAPCGFCLELHQECFWMS